MPPAGFETAISARKRLLIHSLERAATRIGKCTELKGKRYYQNYACLKRRRPVRHGGISLKVSIFISLVVGTSSLLQAYVFQRAGGNMINIPRKTMTMIEYTLPLCKLETRS
jgi:hypothetical protein